MTREISEYGINKQIINQSLNTAYKVLELIKTYVNLSEKVRSEIISGIMEKELSRLLTEKLGFPVKSATSDMEPDLLFTGFKTENTVEIKVAYMPDGRGTWRGGSFSKRDAPHLLIARNSDLSKVYITILHMSPEDWKSPANAGSEEQTYYAHTISKKELLLRDDKVEFYGSVERRLKKDGTPSHMIDMVLEKLALTNS
jgi:hypothetical protein